MKYLNKFNENNNSNEIDLEYIDMCFVDFIDEDRYKSTLFRGNDGVNIDIRIPEEYSIPYSTGSIDDLIKVVKWKEQEYLKVKDALSNGLINAVAETPEEMMEKAKEWIKAIKFKQNFK